MNVVSMLKNSSLEINFNGMLITVVRFTKMFDENAWSISEHAHENFEFHYIWEGKGTIVAENEPFDVSENQFYITGPFVNHKQIADSENPMKEYCIECKITFENGKNSSFELSKIKEFVSLTNYNSYYDTKEMVKSLIEIEEEMNREEFGFNLKVQCLITEIIVDSFRIAYAHFDNLSYEIKKNMNKQRAASIKNYIDGNVKNKITVADVAKEFFISERQIDRIMISEFENTFFGYLVKLRINMAIELLENTTLSIVVVSEQSGFISYQQMFRAFKRFNFNNPKKYRKKGE